ncbi:hypothetical protein TSUD_24750 [Trifolium subterraneum]|uniref:Reverse transcriptase zinc-binding domain-containing protein n=1 Tax=Trifolium subterraneum TaxID=3900 RepID=A0A2Z6P7T7_TRISU|nr:hypothetical protein TSUD_24750 [Trifolium subterraneum]
MLQQSVQHQDVLNTHLINTLNIPLHIHGRLQATVSCFIEDNNWKFPNVLLTAYPYLLSIPNRIAIPLSASDDDFLWNHFHDGNLSFKDAYEFRCHDGQQVPWAKLIWNPAIPLSKSFLLRRSLHDKLPTDENLTIRGCCLPSICNLCCVAAESTSHLFLTYSFASTIWNGLGSILQVHCSFNSIDDSLRLCSHQNSPLCNLVILAAIINILNVIWFCRNQCRFNNKVTHLNTAINLIISGVSLSSNNSKLKAKSSIFEFVILKTFNVQIKNVHNLIIKEVLWQPPILNWVKCNIDGSSLGNPGLSSCGGLFRSCSATFLGAFAYNLCVSNSLVAEINGAMFAIELDVQKDKLANLGLSLASHAWWSQTPSVIKDDMARNGLVLPFYRFS